MSNVEKVSISLSPDLATAVRDAVEGGEYGSASEVVREALREWKLRQPLRRQEVGRLRAAWQEGVASGPSAPLDIEAIKRDAQARLKSPSD
ncbi:MAG: type II toxin-antitoxin system ParD family antitoxin [Rhizobiaceae bacterium]|nr:type II toxin-antitoxin system ParD family antitoxin [Rhizobiaceae bacterium]